MTSPLRSMNIGHVNRLMEAVRIGGEFEMEKFLRIASDIGGYVPGTGSRYKPNDLPGASDEIERFEWVSRWLGLKDPEAKVLFDPGQPLYTPSGIAREHLLAVLEAIRDGEPVDRDIWARNDPERNRVKYITSTGQLVADDSAQILGTESLGTNEEAFAQIRWY